MATKEEADRAVKTAYDAWPAWRGTSIEERAKLLDKLADRLTEDRLELAALQCFEEAKPWREADGDSSARVSCTP